MSRTIKEGALFIADAHYPHHGSDFLKILNQLQDNSKSPSQLFLMGDIFDLLFGHNEYIKTFSQEGITLLNKLSEKLEIIYLEGNHDFCLKEIFPNITVYSREEQPVKFNLNNQTVYLSHGDKYQTGLSYDLYSKFLRRKATLTLLRPFEKSIINHRIGKLKQKNICGDFTTYKRRFNSIRSHYPKKALIIEGHFHQGLTYKNYISLPSLACQRQVAIIKESSLVFVTL